MRRATKWLVFMLIMAMLSAFLLAGSAAALAEEVAEPGEEAGGIVEALVWDDLRTPDGVLDFNDLIDGIKVNLYHLADKKEVGWSQPGEIVTLEVKYEYQDVDGRLWDGTWELYGSKVTGPGGYWWGQEALFEYEHGWVGWTGLPLDDYWGHTFYKVELEDDNTFEPLNSNIRVAHLHVTNWHERKFFPMGYKDMPPFEIQSTSAAISGYVWSDANANLERQFPEKHLADWTIVLTNRYGSRIATAKTNMYGYYYFRGLRSGTYKVWVVDQHYWNQVAPYYKFFTWPPYGCDKGHYTISAVAGKYYQDYDFGMLDMRDSVWAPIYYALWWVGLLQFQFTR